MPELPRSRKPKENPPSPTRHIDLSLSLTEEEAILLMEAYETNDLKTAVDRMLAGYFKALDKK